MTSKPWFGFSPSEADFRGRLHLDYSTIALFQQGLFETPYFCTVFCQAGLFGTGILWSRLVLLETRLAWTNTVKMDLLRSALLWGAAL